MSIAKDGFLSDDVARWIERYRSEHATAFGLAKALNRTGQKLMLSTQPTMEGDTLDARGLTILLFVRVLSNFQGVVLLAERGMVVEARTLARTCLESTFALVAGVKAQDTFIPKMVSHALDARTKAANWLLDRANRADFLKADSEEKLREYLAKVEADGETLAAFAIIDMARRSGLEDLYIFYRALSGDAAHPTLDALNRYIDDRESGLAKEIMWGPKCGAGEINETVLMTCSFMFASCVAINELAGQAEIADELAAQWESYKDLSDEFGVSSAATS